MSEVKKILFLTYLTSYNISEVFKGLAFQNIDDFIEDFVKRSHSGKEIISDAFVHSVKKSYIEKYEEMRYAGINFVTFHDKNYPEPLKRITQAPPMLYVKGKLQKKANVAIVGSREISSYAENNVRKIIDGLSELNGVVSGLALGIDTIAHKIALQNKIYTIAVMPNSLNHVYPRENYRLANEILENDGALVSELAMEINRGKKSFVERNRLQTGLSQFVAPIEMGINSGTMHTVDFCIRQGKYLIVFDPSEEQIKLPQYEGIVYLKHKKNLKKIVLKEPFNLNELIKDMEISQNPTLF